MPRDWILLVAVLLAPHLYAADATAVSLDAGFPSPAASEFGTPVRFKGAVRDLVNPSSLPQGNISVRAGGQSVGFGFVFNGAFDFSVGSQQQYLPVGANQQITLTFGSSNAFTHDASSLSIPYTVSRITPNILLSLPQIEANVPFNVQVSIVSVAGFFATGQAFVLIDGQIVLDNRTSQPLVQGSGVFPAPGLPAGTHTVGISYPGDAYFAPGQAVRTVQVGGRSTLTVGTPVATPSNPRVGDAVTIAVTITGSAGTPTGLVRIYDRTILVGAAFLDSGVARVAVGTLAAGTHQIFATYLGDATYTPAESPVLTLYVGSVETSLSTPVLTSGTPRLGQTLTLLTVITPAAALGSVTFRDGTTTLGSASIFPTGQAVLTTAALGAGPHSITASYAGSGQYLASASPALALAVRATPQVSLQSNLNPAPPGASVTFTANVPRPSPGSVLPTGAIDFREGAATLATVALDASGRAAWTAPANALAPGPHAIAAVYSGDTYYDAATSPVLDQRLQSSQTQTTLEVILDDASITLAAAVTATGGVPTGSVDFHDLSTGATITQPLQAGTAALTGATWAAGHMFRADYRSDAAFDPSSSPQQLVPAALNGFSFALTRFAADEIVTVFGSQLASGTDAAAGLPLPQTLAGASITITDRNRTSRAASLYYASPTQATFVFPSGVASGPATLSIATPGGVFRASITVIAVAPGLASAASSGRGPAAGQIQRVHPGGERAPLEATALFDPATGSWSPTPITFAGDDLYLVLYGTGFRNRNGAADCTIGGRPVAALYAGAQASYPGLDQLNLPLSPKLQGAGLVDLICTADGRASNALTLLFP